MLALVCAALLLGSSAGDPFSDLEYDAALAQAQKEKKLLLVDFRAEWCGPCKKMEKDTWADEGVRAWVKENALAIQVDVDKKPKLAEQFHIEGIPAVIALREGQEFDRSVGYKDPGRFLAWARDVRAGKRSSDELLERAKALEDSQHVDARYDLARDLLRAGKYDEALAEYLWLWPATRDTALGSGRLSFMLRDMARLAEKHPPAKEAFQKIFDELQQRVDAAEVPTFEDWQEWKGFCDYFGQDARVIAWYEKRRDSDGRLFRGEQHEFQEDFIVSEVFDVLIKSARPLDAVRLYDDVRIRAEQIVTQYQLIRQDIERHANDPTEDVTRYGQQKLIQDLSRLYAALLLAERREEAADVAQKLLTTLDSPDSRLGLVRAGLDLVKRPEESFGRWLDEAEQAGGKVRSLRKRLEKLQKDGGGSDGR